MSIYRLKPVFQNFLRPVLRGLRRIGVSPNAITVSALVLSALAGGAVAFGQQVTSLLFAVPAALFLRMALNALDGMMAREYSLESRSGEVLNEVGDVLSDVLIYLPFAFLVDNLAAQIAVVAFCQLAALTEFAGVLSAKMVGKRAFDGPLGKSDRAFLVGAFALVVGVWPDALSAVAWVFGVGAALLVVTTLKRLRPLWSDACSREEVLR